MESTFIPDHMIPAFHADTIARIRRAMDIVEMAEADEDRCGECNAPQDPYSRVTNHRVGCEVIRSHRLLAKFANRI